jgi:hypothetical protein
MVDVCGGTATRQESDGENTQRVDGASLHHTEGTAQLPQIVTRIAKP